MSDDIKIQSQSPATQFLKSGIGGAIGGACGYYAANSLPFKKPMYNNYMEIINEVKDIADFTNYKSAKSQFVTEALDKAKYYADLLPNIKELSLNDIYKININSLNPSSANKLAFENAIENLKNASPSKDLVKKVARNLNSGAEKLTQEMLDAAKNEINNNKLRYFKDEADELLSALGKLIEESPHGFTQSFKSKIESINSWRSSAEEGLKPLLEKCKIGNKKLWAGVGAAMLFLSTWFAISNKNKKE